MDLSFFSVFLAGVVSFFSPCVVPLIPMYVGFLAGDITNDAKRSRRLYLNAAGFLLGLVTVFIALGAVATALGSLLLSQQALLRQVSGILIILLGVFQMGIIKLSFLTKTRQFRVRPKGSRFFTALVMGMAFSFGWTPCVGPILATVLLYAANAETFATGMWLLVSYALGFVVPFVLSTVLMERASKFFEASGVWLERLKFISGILMVIVGLLVYFNYLNKITAFLM